MMSEKFYLKWNDFKDIRISAFGNLRNNVDFADVILACGDGQQVKAHKVLGGSEPFLSEHFEDDTTPSSAYFHARIEIRRSCRYCYYLYC